MTVRIEKGKSIFDLNLGLDKLFPKLNEEEMEYVVYYADMNSLFRVKPEKERRFLSLKLVEGLWYNGKPTAKGQRIAEGKNKDVEAAIVQYHKDINNNKSVMVQKTLDTLNDYYEGVLKFMKKLDDTGDFDEQVKVYTQNAKSIKDEIIKATYEQILYFEKQLSYEFEVPEEILNDVKEKEDMQSNTADNIDVDTL